MRLIAWIIGLPLAVVAIMFAVANRQDVRFDLWPLPFSILIPAYLCILAPLALGLLAGALLGWSSGLGARHHAREQRRRAESLVRQLEAVTNKPS